MTTPTPPPAAPAADAKNAPPPPTQPFRVGSLELEKNDYDETVTMTTATLEFPGYEVKPNGWLAGLWFLFEATTTGNSANVAYTEDGVFAAIQKINFFDVGTNLIFGGFTGYDWLNVMKWGGYHEIGDPRADPNFQAVTGSGSAGGSFTMIMYLPLEIVHRDTLGAIENKSTSTTYSVEIVLNQSSAVYSVSPTTLPSVRLRVTTDGYSQPAGADSMGNPVASSPPVPGTIQRWGFENEPLSAGQSEHQVKLGLGYPMRNVIFKLVDSNGSRAGGDAIWPDPCELDFGDIRLFNRYKKIWISKMAKSFGLTSMNADVAGGRENGVFPVWFNRDFGFKPGAELRNGLLQTKTGNLVNWEGVIGGSGTSKLYAYVNYILVPGAGGSARLRSSR